MDVAYWFILKNNSERCAIEDDDYEVYEPITHLKLQKLIYYAHGIYLSITGRPLIDEEILAWQHGPVIDEVYQVFKSFNKDPLDIEINEIIAETMENITKDHEMIEALNLTYENFAGYTAWQLRQMTHEKGTPWYNTPINDVIENDLIKEYFCKQVME